MGEEAGESDEPVRFRNEIQQIQHAIAADVSRGFGRSVPGGSAGTPAPDDEAVAGKEVMSTALFFAHLCNELTMYRLTI
jgi:hypothetical protein